MHGKRRQNSNSSSTTIQNDEYNDQEIDDICRSDFPFWARGLTNEVSVSNEDFQNIDDVVSGKAPKAGQIEASAAAASNWNPEKLVNGKWACNHKCKDKNT